MHMYNALAYNASVTQALGLVQLPSISEGGVSVGVIDNSAIAYHGVLMARLRLYLKTEAQTG